MSRSYKKVAASPIASSRGDKSDRSIYHRAERRKVRSLLREIDISYESVYSEDYIKAYNKPPAEDRIITKGIDYSLKFSDRWSWGSDGGAYWQSNKSEMRKEFDKAVFGLPYYSWRWLYNSFPKNEIWNDYLKYRNAAQNKKHSYYKWRTLWNGQSWRQHVRGPKTACSDFGIVEMLFYRRQIPFSFWGPEDLVAWFRAHEEEILTLSLKMRYLRK